MSLELLQKDFGLSEKEAMTYMAILELGSSTIKPISAKSGVKRTSIYNFINNLVNLGLIVQSTQKGKTYYSAYSPEKLIEIQKERLARIEKNIPMLMGQFNDKAPRPRVSYYEGKDQLKTLIREVLNCHKEVLYIWPGSELSGEVGGKDYLESIAQERLDKNIFVRLVRFAGREPLFPDSASGLEYLRENRWAPKNLQGIVEMIVAIYDTGKVGLLAADGNSYGALIESKSFEKTMRMLFELLWEVSIPAKVGEG